MRVFVLSVGRVGSTTLARACSHIHGFTAAHESRAKLLGDERFDYPDQHIEVDHRLSWFLGDLGRRFDDEQTLYVHQTRDRDEVVESWLGRWDSLFRPTMVRAFGHGIIMQSHEWSDAQRRRVVEFYVDSVNANIAEFIRHRRHEHFDIATAIEDFDHLVESLGAPCDRDAAVAQLRTRHNASRRGQAVARRLRFRHVLPVVGRSAPSDLRRAQRETLTAVERAVAFGRQRVDVSVVGARFADEDLPASYLEDAPVLTASSQDLGDFARRRRLPLLRQVLEGLRTSDHCDYLIYTNIDIAPQPGFYEVIDEIARRGHDFFTITRRDVAEPFTTSPAVTRAQLGFGHPGTDTIVFKASLLDEVDVGDVLLGVKWVARALVWQLTLLAERPRHFHDLHATYHLGYDQAWKDPALADYEEFNRNELKGCLERWTDRFGTEAVGRLSGVSAVRSGPTGASPVPTRPQLSPQPKPSKGHRMIFCASPGRSGTAYLAQLLGSHPGVDAGHERRPAMIGPWLRQSTWSGMSQTYAARRVKADAIRVELSRLAEGTAYADTSHMFIKTFCDVVFDEFPHDRISVVVLNRPPDLVAKSFFDLGYFAADRDPWLDWMAVPSAPHSMAKLDPDEITSQFDLIFGYLADILLRTELYRERTPQVDWVDVDLGHLQDPVGAAMLFDSLGLSRPKGLDRAVGERVNGREHVKRRVGGSVPLEIVNEHLDSYLRRFSSNPGTGLLANARAGAVAT